MVDHNCSCNAKIATLATDDANDLVQLVAFENNSFPLIQVSVWKIFAILM